RRVGEAPPRPTCPKRRPELRLLLVLRARERHSRPVALRRGRRRLLCGRLGERLLLRRRVVLERDVLRRVVKEARLRPPRPRLVEEAVLPVEVRSLTKEEIALEEPIDERRRADGLEQPLDLVWRAERAELLKQLGGR